MELKKLKTKRLLLVACSGLFLVLMIFLYLAWENPNGGRRAWKYPNNNIFAIPTTSPYTPFSEKVQETPLSVIVGNSYEDEYVRLHRQDLLKKTNGVKHEGDLIYLDGELLSSIDAKTFTDLGQYYFKDNSAVYYYNRASFGHGSLLTLPFDPSTFRILDVVQIKPNDLTLHGYVSDKNGVYYGNVLVKGADQVSFSLVGYTEYTGDKGGRTTPIYYGKDKSSVYYQGKLLEGADSDSFEIIPNGPYYQEFAKDRASVFYNEKKVTGADPKTYKPLSGQPYEGCSEGPYGVDKTSVYYQNIKIEGADVKTFEVMVGDDSYGKDVHYFYHRSERADPKTFKACSYG